MSNPRCDTCRFGIETRINPTDIKPSLECRGAPPNVALIPGPNGSARAVFLPRIMPEDYWCGQFQPRPTVLC